MRAGLRWKKILLAACLWLSPATAFAQDANQAATTNTPATDTIGPRELQNFSLPGTRTRPAEQAPAQPAPTTSTPRPENAAPARAATREPARRSPPPSAPGSSPAGGRPAPSILQETTEPALPSPSEVTPALLPQPTLGTPIERPAVPPAADRKLRLLPWIAAALALGGAAILFLWWRRPRHAYVGPEFDLFAAPEPAPQPAPAAPVREPPKPVARATTGIVASRLRPSIEIGMQPLRCLVEDEQVTIEFEVDLYNAGTAPARAVFAEASLLNASATQDQELAAFFASPGGAGERLDAIQPMKRVTLTSRVVAPRAAIQEYELAGRKAFVPVIAFNALYEWSGGKEQASAAYLVGRGTKGDKLGPLRLDLGPREFGGLDARPLPAPVRI